MKISEEMLIKALRESICTPVPQDWLSEGAQPLKDYFIPLSLYQPKVCPDPEKDREYVNAEEETESSPFNIEHLFTASPHSVSAPTKGLLQLIRGPAGSGKSTFCQYIAQAIVNGETSQWPSSPRIALKLHLKRLAL